MHLIGLVSDGGVHSSLEHLRALIAVAPRAGAVSDLVVHAFTDGRDTLPHAGAGFLAELDARRGRARRLGGRPLLGDGPRPPLGPHAARLRPARPRRRRRTAPPAARRPSRRPTSAGRRTSSSSRRRRRGGARIRPGDSVLAFNFRPDRMRELTRALAEPGFGEGGEELPGWDGRARRPVRATRP